MKYYYNLFCFGLITVAGAASLTTNKKVLAVGCDTYYRVTGQIAGCTDVSTDKAQSLWLEKYSICLKQQLDRKISVYRSQLRTQEAQWDSKNADQYSEFDNLSFSDLDTSLSLSTDTYRGNADFCPD